MYDLLADYQSPSGGFDELLDDNGQVRAHWRNFYAQLQRTRPQQLSQRQAMLARQLQENGVTYNVYADPAGADRPWELDLLPHLISAEEWQGIAAGLAQRAALLNRVLGDIYGEQSLMAKGLLPAELVFGHDNYLWPCQGLRPAGGTWLHVYAVDLARGPDGRWWVTADRTQAPSGAGYALENRLSVSRAFPEAYRDLHVQYLGGYFRTLQDTLARQAPSAGETPLVVLLTPGRFNESYFEHLYLARQLGYPLVEGSDLTVRDATLYLKTMAGLRRVHAVLRRLDDDYCDPLELRTDSALGVPGLLEVARQGRVLIANALGSGVLESPGLGGFLPAIAEHWLGEALLLPSIASWWCGEPPVLEQALEKLDELLVRPAFPSQRFNPVFGGELDAAQRQALAQRIQERPYAYVAQARPHLSQAPVFDGSALAPRAIGMRVFAVASADGGYRIMPGALTRVAGEADAEAVSMQRGGASKDTWVIGQPTAGEPWQPPRPLSSADIVRSDPFLPSRVVENLFWFGRYAERCQDSARLLRIMLARYVDDDDDPRALLSALALAEELGLLPPVDSGSLSTRLLEAVVGQDWPASLRANLQRLQWTAGSVRGKLSQANWQALLELQRETQLLERPLRDFGQVLDFLNRLLMSLAALSGFALDDMTRDDGWRLMMVGRYIERLQFLCDSLGAFLQDESAMDQSALEWLLELGNSSITYRTRYLASAQLIPVLDLLLLDTQNPHSVLFQMRTLRESLKHLAEGFELPQQRHLYSLERKVAAFSLSSLEPSLLGSSGTQAVLEGLAGLLKQISSACAQASDHLALRFFVHVDASQRTQSS